MYEGQQIYRTSKRLSQTNGKRSSFIAQWKRWLNAVKEQNDGTIQHISPVFVTAERFHVFCW